MQRHTKTGPFYFRKKDHQYRHQWRQFTTTVPKRSPRDEYRPNITENDGNTNRKRNPTT